MFVFVALLAITLFGLLHLIIKFSRFARMLKDLPRPSEVPIIGSCLELLGSPVEIFALGRKMNAMFPDIYVMWFFTEPVISIQNPEDAELFLTNTKNINKSAIYDAMRSWLGEGLLLAGGNKWRMRRKMLTPAFHFNILRQFCEVFNEQTKQFVQKLSLEVEKDKDVVDIFPKISDFSLRVICETAMGIKLDQLSVEEGDRYRAHIKELTLMMCYRALRPWLAASWAFALTAVHARQRPMLEEMHRFTDKVIAQRRATSSTSSLEAETLGKETDEEVEEPRKRRLAMLDLLLAAEARGEIDAAGIREEVDMFMFAGHDTTTTALSCILMELANNEAIQQRLVEEIEEIFDTVSTPITMETLNKLTYLDRVIKEGLRLYPSAPLMGRKLSEDLKLKNYTIPAGSTLQLHIFDLHRRPEIYPNPKVFDPDRFLPENVAKRHPFAYVPFSAGPRNCIGQKFAMFEMKALISTILKFFKLEPVTKRDEVVFKADVVLTTASPVIIKFVHKNSNLGTIKDLML